MNNIFDNSDNYEDSDNRIFNMDDLFQDDMEDEVYGNRALNGSILESTLRLLEASFFWKFKSLPAKIRMMKETYQQIRLLIDENYIGIIESDEGVE